GAGHRRLRGMRAIGWLALLAAFAPAARADLIDLSGDSRRSRKAPAFVLRAEGGSEFAPYGRAGACFSYLAENPLGGFEIEVGAGAGFPGVQLGLAVRQLFGDGGDYLAFEIALAGNTVRKLGA